MSMAHFCIGSMQCGDSGVHTRRKFAKQDKHYDAGRCAIGEHGRRQTVCSPANAMRVGFDSDLEQKNNKTIAWKMV